MNGFSPRGGRRPNPRGRLSSHPPARPPRAAPRFDDTPIPDGVIEEILLEARELAEKGAIRTAMERAGEAVRLDASRPEGYLLLGEFNLLDGDPDEALRTFTAARAKAARARQDFLQDPAEVRLLAATGEGHALRVLGKHKDAALAYAAAMAEDASDPLSLATHCCESWLAAGDVTRACGVLPPIEGASPDAHLVAAFACLKAGQRKEFVVRARLAMLGNLYLLSAMVSGETPDFGLVHGMNDATPEAAVGFAERLLPLVRSDPTLVDALAAVAASAGPASDMTRFLGCAQRMTREPDAGLRNKIAEELELIRDEARIRATSDAVLTDWDFTDATHDGNQVDV